MPRLVTTREVHAAEAPAFWRARDGVVLEREVDRGRFEAVEGPVRDWTRTVSVEHVRGPIVRVTETVEFRPAFLFFAPLFAPLLRMAARRGDGRYWWAPPQRIDARAARSLDALAAASVVGGYLGILLTTTIAFAAREFDASAGAQGAVGIAVRFAGFAAFLAALVAADRFGRRRVVVWAGATACVVALAGAASASLVWLAATQSISRSLALAALATIGIAAAEEMPRGSRAYAVSLLGLSASLGGGLAVMALPLADLGAGGWRLLYLVPALGLPLLYAVSRRLPETRRFATPHTPVPLLSHRARLWLLGASAFLANIIAAPAGFFASRYLLEERGFTALGIAVLTIATSTPGAVGVVVGGRLADLHGRRRVGAVAVSVGAVAVAGFYLSSGVALWGWSLLGAIIGSAALPALGVYGPELFPTSLRGRAGAVLGLIGLAGSAAGLLAAGLLADATGSLGRAIAPLALGPLVLSVLVLVAYPETAGRSLEEINPEDRTPMPR